MATDLARAAGETPSDHVSRMAAVVHGLQGRLRRKSEEAEALSLAHDEKEASLEEIHDRLERCRKLHPITFTMLQQGLITLENYTEERWIDGKPVLAISGVAVGLATSILGAVMGSGTGIDVGIAVLNASLAIINVKATGTKGAEHREQDRRKAAAAGEAPTPAGKPDE